MTEQIARQRDAFLRANNLRDADRFTFQILTSEILADKDFSDPAVDVRPAKDLATEVMIEATDAYLETLEPLIATIPSEDRADAVTLNGQAIRRARSLAREKSGSRRRKTGTIPVFAGEKSMKLVSSVPLDEGQQDRLRSIAPALEVVSKWARTPKDLAELLDADTQFIYSFRLPMNTMEKAPGLQWVQLMGAGCEHLSGNPIMDTSARITTVSGVHATPIAEYVLGTMLMLYRGLHRSFRAQIEHRWIPQDDFARTAREVRGRTVGILGYGSIGREVARLVQPFGARVVALKRDPKNRMASGYHIEGTGDPEGSIPERIFGPEDLHDFLGESDVVVIALPSTDRTRGLLGSAEFRAMKPGAYLINIARGDVLVEPDLIAALKNGPMGGAALDVFEEEPLPESSEFWDMENVIVTSHMSGASRPYLRRCFEVLFENFRRYQNGDDLLNCVDRVHGY